MPGTPPQRPHVHFSCPQGWLNDPNGLVHADGVYHLHFQHAPDTVTWGPMHWGHATSTDLVTWADQPIALFPGPDGACWSGSAVVDTEGGAGFGAGALVAVFTLRTDDFRQVQALAGSVDAGLTWQRHPANPVLVAPAGIDDFRDPKVVRTDVDAEPWLMVLAVGQEIWFYRSADLVAWRPVSTWTEAEVPEGQVWETPDLLRCGDDWLLTFSVSDAGGVAYHRGTCAVVGRWEDDTFTATGPTHWVDHGPDFYAPQSWAGVSDRIVWLGWLDNWAYAAKVPADTWRGVMTLPREVRIVEGRIAQRPVPEVELRRRTVVAPTTTREVTVEQVGAADVVLTVDPGAEVTIEVHVGEGAATRIRYEAGQLVLQRAGHGDAPPSDSWSAQVEATAPFDLRVIADTTSVEVFADRGRVVLTARVFPARSARRVCVRADRPVEMAVYDLAVSPPR